MNAPSLEYGAALEGFVDGDDEEDAGLAVDIREKLMNAGWALLTAKIGKDGKARCHLDAASPVGKREFISNQKFTTLQDVTLKLAIFVDGNRLEPK